MEVLERSTATVHGPDPITLEGRPGDRYWVFDPFSFTGDAAVDERLSGYPLAVFQPEGRPPEETPVVIGLQGLAAPYQWNGFLVPTLLDMGIAVALFDAPLAGERSLARNHLGDIVSEVVPLVQRRVRVGVEIVARLMEGVARDIGTVLSLLRERHELPADRLALFGVSLGALLTSYAFLRDGIGSRLLCAIGHSDVRLFARSYAPALTPVLVSLPCRLLGRVAGLFCGPVIRATADFLGVLHKLTLNGEHAASANPMKYLDRAGRLDAGIPACRHPGMPGGRPVRFLVGAADPLVRPEDAAAVAKQFPDGECFVVPGLGHGGEGFVEHVRTFVGTQLGDWKW